MLFVGFIIAQVIILGVIIVVLKRLIFSDTNSAVNRLTKIDNLNREKEKLLQRKLDQAHKFIEEQKSKMENEGQKLKQESKRASIQLHEDIVRKAKAEADEIVKKAQAAKDQIRIEAMIEAEGKMIDLCVDLLNSVMANTIQTDFNNNLVEEFIEELEKADLEKINLENGNIELHSARDIAKKYQDQIKNVLTGKLKKPVSITVKEDPLLVGGVMMKLGTMVVDGSLCERLRESSVEIKEKLNWKYAK